MRQVGFWNIRVGSWQEAASINLEPECPSVSGVSNSTEEAIKAIRAALKDLGVDWETDDVKYNGKYYRSFGSLSRGIIKNSS